MLYGPFISSGIGQPVFINPSLLGTSGNYRLQITSTAASGISVDAVRNAALESQSGDSTPSSEVNLNGTFTYVGAGRYAVIGHSDAVLQETQQNLPGGFVDISGTGTPLNLGDDSAVTITTTIGNSLLPAGSVTISNNGFVRPGTVASLSYVNSALTSGFAGLFPFWDDIDSDTGNVYWQQRQVGGIDTFIVQWEDRPHYQNIGSATFQIQVFATGNTLVRFAYEDVVFGDTSVDNGASATIGIVSPSGEVSQHSFNTVNAVANGDVIDYIAVPDFDEYEFNANAGQQVDVIFAGLNGVDMTSTQVRLMNGTTVLANAVTNPLSPTTTAANYDRGIVGFIIPANGVYTVRVIGVVDGDYATLITKNSVFGTENSTGDLSPPRVIRFGINALGFLDSADDAIDDYLLPLTAGQQVRVDLALPFSHPLNTPLNSLVPRLQARTQSGAHVVTNTSSGPGGLPRLVFTAAETGNYRIRANSLSGQGEYTINATLLSSLAPFDSKATKPELTATGGITKMDSPTFTWVPLDGAESYEVWINSVTTKRSVYLRQIVADASFTPAADFNNGSYQIFVQGIFPDDTRSGWSAASSFDVRPQVSWITTNGSTTTQQPTIRWEALGNASRYDLWIDNRTTGVSQVVRNQSVSSTTFTPVTLLDAGVYRMWVRGIDAQGNPGTWSSALQLNVTQVPVFSGLTQVSRSAIPSFNWNTVSAAASYSLWVDRIGVQSGFINQKGITTTSFTPSALPSGNYRIWLRAVADDGTLGAWSSPVNVTIAAVEAAHVGENRIRVALLELERYLDFGIRQADGSNAKSNSMPDAVNLSSPDSVNETQSEPSVLDGSLKNSQRSPELPARSFAGAAILERDFASLDLLLSSGDFDTWNRF